MTASNIISNVILLARKLTGRNVIRDIITYNDPDYGSVIRLIVNMNAREALDLWLKLVKQFPYEKHGIVIGVEWLGKDNVTEEELIDYAVKVMYISGLRTKAIEPLDVVRKLREERNKR